MSRLAIKSFFSVVIVFVWFVFVGASGCPTATESNLDTARFNIDKCDPSDSTTFTTFCQAALDAATLILADDPTNVEAASIASSARLGLAGVDFLQFISKLVGAQSTSTQDTKEFADLITEVEAANGVTINRTQLRAAGAVLETALTGLSGNSLTNSAFFQLGAVQAVETFVTLAKVSAGTFTDSDVSQFKSNAKNGDSNLSVAGVSDANTLRATREGHCRCKLADPLGENYGTSCLSDLKTCFIESSGIPIQSYGAGADRASRCSALENPSGVATCKDTNQ